MDWCHWAKPLRMQIEVLLMNLAFKVSSVSMTLTVL